MATRRPGGCYVWVTWISSLLAGEASCQWRAWFQAHYSFQKVEDPSFDQAAYKAAHSDLLGHRAMSLRAAGHYVTIEDQNSFKLTGHRGVLSGKPDIIARKDDNVIVSDAKTGQPRASDKWQVIVYITALRKLWAPTGLLPAPRIAGEVVYASHPPLLVVPAEHTGERVFEMLRLICGDEAPPKVPSPRECRYCPIPKSECQERLDGVGVPEVLVSEF